MINKKVISLLAIMLILWGCASGPSTTRIDNEVYKTDIGEAESELTSAIDKIILKFEADQDKNALQEALVSLAADYQQQGNCNASNAVIKYAIPVFSTPNALAKANILRSECILLEMEQAKQMLSSPSSSSAYTQNPYDLVLAWYASAEESQLPIDWQARAAIVRAYLLAGQESYEAALRIALEQSNAESVLTPYLTDFAFDSFAHMSTMERDTALKEFDRLNTFESLLDVIEDTELNETQRQTLLTELVTELSLNGRLSSLPEQISRYLRVDFDKHQHTAVLLPLSGRLATQGEAIKKGILASYFAQQHEQNVAEYADENSMIGVDVSDELDLESPIMTSFELSESKDIDLPETIMFIDTGSEDTLPETISRQSLQAFDTVIGPLLKPQIVAIQKMLSTNTVSVHLNQRDESILTIKKSADDLTEATISTDGIADKKTEDSVPSKTSLTVPVVALETGGEQDSVVGNADNLSVTELLTSLPSNKQDVYTPPVKANYFALSPEQEAAELALEMLESKVKHPVIVHKDSRATNRMVESFLLTWKQDSSSENSVPVEVTYTDNNSVRVGITSALDVMQSQQRIDQLLNLSSEEVYSVTRNRRDIDAFVVFARPDEIELINPIIETSISFFSGRTLPVFSSSYGYNHKYNKNTLRDLRSLIFVDMPFLLPQQRNSELATELDEILNEPSSTFLRLFAFGYDALSLSREAEKLRIFQHLYLIGLSGQLSIDDAGIVHRKLNKLSISTDI